MIGVAAMLSTASAINATLYGSARMTYTIGKIAGAAGPTRPTGLGTSP